MPRTRRLPGALLLTIEIVTLILLIFFSELWRWFFVLDVVIIVYFLLPLANVPNYAMIIANFFYLRRKIKKHKIKGKFIEKRQNYDRAIIVEGPRYVFVLQIIRSNDPDAPRGINLGIFVDLLQRKNGIIFDRISIVNMYTSPDQPPRTYLYFTFNSLNNVAALEARSAKPIDDILYTASLYIHNRLIQEGFSSRFLPTAELIELAKWFLPENEQATYVRGDKATWTMFASNQQRHDAIMEKFQYPVNILHEMTLYRGAPRYYTFIAAPDIAGSVSAKTNISGGQVRRIRFQQYPILIKFIPHPINYRIWGIGTCTTNIKESRK